MSVGPSDDPPEDWDEPEDEVDEFDEKSDPNRFQEPPEEDDDSDLYDAGPSTVAGYMEAQGIDHA